MSDFLPIVPSSVVYLLTGVRLDNSYENTIIFQATGSQTAEEIQHAYFSSKILSVGGSYTGLSYQRVDSNKMRLQAGIDTVMKADYLMFRNPSFENKWFYAFITNAKYINNTVTEIEYEIDVMQTWFYDCTLLQSFIEREHASTDNPGDNIIPENVETGDELVTLYKFVENYDQMSIYVIWKRVDNDNPAAKSYTVINGNVYTGIKISEAIGAPESLTPPLSDPVPLVLPTNTPAYLEYFTSQIVSSADDVEAIYEFPTALKPTGGKYSQDDPSKTMWTDHAAVNKNLPKMSGNTMLISLNYTPRNKKLMTYPYRCIRVTNGSGESSIYKYENFAGGLSNTNFTFVIDPTFAPIPEISCYPQNYLSGGYYGGNQSNDNIYGLALTNFMQCAFTKDTFTSWWNANANQFQTRAIASAITPMLSALIPTPSQLASRDAMAGGLITGTISGLTATGVNIANSVAKVQDMKNAPDTMKGQFGACGLPMKQGRYGFTFEFCSIKTEFLRTIDAYFDLYGYATKKVKVPNIDVRAHWCYTKTNGCNIIPKTNRLVGANEIRAIKAIFNNGIRFWKNGDEIGNYALDNTLGGV